MSWSKTSTVNGQVVSQETGGWTDAWTDSTTWSGDESGGMAVGGAPRYPSVWQQVGYDRAPVGIREEVRRLVKIRKLMKIISKDCGNPPTPSAETVVGQE